MDSTPDLLLYIPVVFKLCSVTPWGSAGKFKGGVKRKFNEYNFDNRIVNFIFLP